MKQTIQLRLGQSLTMTPQLQQAIRLLQLSTLDLQREIQEALDTNFMLEEADEADRTAGVGATIPSDGLGVGESADPVDAGAAAVQEAREAPEERELRPEETSMGDELPLDSQWDDTFESYLPSGGQGGEDNPDYDPFAHRGSPLTLHDHLLWQLNLSRMDESDRAIATAVIDAVNLDGYLSADIDELVATIASPDVGPDEVWAVLHQVQAFDPPGVAARDLQECLLLQLRQLPPETPMLADAIAVCTDHFQRLAKGDMDGIAKRLGLSSRELALAIGLIRSLNPRPGSAVADMQPEYIIPDVLVTRRGGTWHCELNPETTPKLRVNADYAKLLRRADQAAANACLKDHLQEARWFIKSLASRNDTVLRVATKIVELQRGFLEFGEEAMRPMVLRDVADALELHESTVSRVTTQKYMHTPRGTLEFKYFFSSHVNTASGGECSSTAIRALLRKLVAAEAPGKPFSDHKLAEILDEQGIKVARRTIAKYREALGIPPSSERKRLS
jgi:RNA polymerase sigma-54 factor